VPRAGWKGGVTATLRNSFDILTYGAQRTAGTLGIKWQPDRSRGY
jgi:hypothetical protein